MRSTRSTRNLGLAAVVLALALLVTGVAGTSVASAVPMGPTEWESGGDGPEPPPPPDPWGPQDWVCCGDGPDDPEPPPPPPPGNPGSGSGSGSGASSTGTSDPATPDTTVPEDEDEAFPVDGTPGKEAGRPDADAPTGTELAAGDELAAETSGFPVLTVGLVVLLVAGALGFWLLLAARRRRDDEADAVA